MKPGDIVSFNIIKNDQVAFEVQGELVELNFTPTVSTASLKLIKSKANNVFTQEETIMRPKDYLESGLVVIFAEGSRGIVVSLKGVNFILIKNKLIPLQKFDENLHFQFSEKYDIVKIAELEEGCALEHFDMVREEMLDIIWEEKL